MPTDLAWSDINPRQRRYRGPSDVRTLISLEHDEFEVTSQEGTKLTIRRKRRQPPSNKGIDPKRLREKTPRQKEEREERERIRFENKRFGIKRRTELNEGGEAKRQRVEAERIEWLHSVGNFY